MNKKSFCPFCNDFFEFLPFGNPKRLNAQCPNCLSLERHREDLKYITKIISILKRKKKKIYLLHTSPERCFYNFFKNIDDLVYVPVNLTSNDKLIKVVCDIQNLPFKDKSFDAIYSCHVLEHVENDLLALIELHRVLKKNGFALINVPLKWNLNKTLEESWINTPELREKYYGQHDHLRLYGKDFVDKLSSAKFTYVKAGKTSFICFKRS